MPKTALSAALLPHLSPNLHRQGATRGTTLHFLPHKPSPNPFPPWRQSVRHLSTHAKTFPTAVARGGRKSSVSVSLPLYETIQLRPGLFSPCYRNAYYRHLIVGGGAGQNYRTPRTFGSVSPGGHGKNFSPFGTKQLRAYNTKNASHKHRVRRTR